MVTPVAVELARLDELVHTLRARCPWDQSQTHGSLARHLLEETYETLDAIEALGVAEALGESEADVIEEAVDHLAEELGDLLFQVYFHAVLAGEEGRFTLADVARGVHDKLVARHPHVFGDVLADTPEEVAANWEILKTAEKGRSSVTEGIPSALPALALAVKLQRKAGSVGLELPDLESRRRQVADGVDRLESSDTQEARDEAMGDLLFALADLVRLMGVEPETALRTRAGRFRRQIEASEGSVRPH
jgi:tetrapyrrole methylase family protein/MazG family protein